MSSDEEERALRKQIFKNPVEVQKARLDRLMTNVQKPVFIPEKKETKLPRAFQPHEYVRNVMGKIILNLLCLSNFCLSRRKCWCWFR
jgi:hypothetical protein